MCSTCCAVSVVGEYREQQFVVATGVVSRQCGRLGGDGKKILNWVIRRMNWEFIIMASDGICPRRGIFSRCEPSSFQEPGFFLVKRI